MLNIFYNCTNLRSILLPENLESIDNFAFRNCSGLTEVVIPDSVKEIGSFAFYQCQNIKSLVIGASVDTINAAFDGCISIEKIYCKVKTPPNFTSINTFPYDKKLNYFAMLFIPQESIDLYKSHNMWKRFKIASLMDLTPEEGYAYPEYWNENIDARGVTADGLSKLKVTKEDQPSDVPDLQSIKVKFELDGEECTDENIIGTYGVIEWKGDKECGFTYTAPEEFPDIIKGNEYTLNVTLEYEEKGLLSVVGAAQIKVLRPGVMFVHGLKSNASCFASVENYLTSIGGYKDYQIKLVNYASSNKASFENNTTKNGVIGNNARKLFIQMANKGIVSSSYDMIGHSMGGILIRKYAQEVDKKSVNRIITVNTPHSGSPLGNLYNKAATFVVMESILSRNVYGMIVIGAVKMLAEYQKKWGNWGGVQDLATDSKAIQLLNNPGYISNASGIPVHAICSTIEINNEETNETISQKSSGFTGLLPVISFLESKTKEKLNDISILNNIFGKDSHDGIVPLQSQLGGLATSSTSTFDGPYKGLFGFSSLTHHCNITSLSSLAIRIKTLLHEPKTSDVFEKSFSPIVLSNDNLKTRSSDETLAFKEPSESQFIKIHAEQEDAERVLKVTVTGSDDLWANLVFIGIDDENLLTGIGQNEYRFSIPDTYEGDLTVYALGRTEDDALVGNSVVIKYEKTASLKYLYFEDWPKVTMVEGQQLELNVIGGWSNGNENYVAPYYSTNKEGILEFDGSLITAKAEGECLLIANYDGLADTITVKVVSSKTSTILKIEKNKPSIRYRDGSLVVVPETDYTGKIMVMIYDMSGNLCCQQYRDVNERGNEPITFDLSSLSKQLYIARVRTSEEYAIKFVKR